jgi:hypothetical protein
MGTAANNESNQISNQIKPIYIMSVTLDQLTPEAKAELLKELQKSEADERKAYKDLVNDTVPALFHELIGVAADLSRIKTLVFGELQALIKMKADVYGKEENTYSHSFTTADGITIMIGHRYTDGWDDTASAGIERVNNYIQSMGTDSKSKMLVSAVLRLLSKDTKGNLKASRVLQLKKLAEETGDLGFLDAVNIIHDAYRPVKSREFITCRYKTDAGEAVDLPLDITAADFDFQMPEYAKQDDNKEGKEV